MPIYDHITEFMGRPVEPWEPGRELVAPAGKMIRVAADDEPWTENFATLLEDPAARRITGLVIGPWGAGIGDPPDAVVEALVAARDNLPDLRAVFFGDITVEECEISWIIQ